jgi:lysozyme
MLVALVVAAVVTLAVRRDTLATFRPTVNPGEDLGLDVSHYQGEIDWQAVAADGISFAYIKSTEAGDWADEYFVPNWLGARTAGLEVGAYHFFTFCRTGADQAANVLRVVPADEADLPLAVDLEFANHCSQRSDPEGLRAELRMFIDMIEATTGGTVVLYVEDAFDDVYKIKDNFDNVLWQRDIGETPPSGQRWFMWQFSDRATVDGVNGGVDMNLRRSLDR